MKPLERLKQTIRRSLIKPAPVVLNEKDGPAILGFNPKLNAGMIMKRSILPGVSQQVIHRNSHQARICVSFSLHRRNKFHRLEPHCGHNSSMIGPCKCAQIDHLAMHAARSDAGEIQQVVDQFRHALGRSPDALQRLYTARIKFARGILEQQITEPVERIKRAAQIVRHRIGKCLQLSVR